MKNRDFVGFFQMAWGLLIDRRGSLAARRGDYRSYAMLFALGAATAALDAVSSLTSSSTSSSSASSPQSTGFSAVDPFEITSPASASTGSAPVSGSQISPTTLNTLIAAQSQSSTGSTPTSASDAWQDLSSQLDSDAGSSDSSAAASSYNSLAQMFQQQINAVSFSAPPLSFSV